MANAVYLIPAFLYPSVCSLYRSGQPQHAARDCGSDFQPVLRLSVFQASFEGILPEALCLWRHGSSEALNAHGLAHLGTHLPPLLTGARHRAADTSDSRTPKQESKESHTLTGCMCS